ncbi:hypothetical protein B0H13DRAFT_2306695 [Mycena leptocephala]|nr:hypothetical protein B0H13DRAFT_2306695 [Mycena leptocephala]
MPAFSTPRFYWEVDGKYAGFLPSGPYLSIKRREPHASVPVTTITTDRIITIGNATYQIDSLWGPREVEGDLSSVCIARMDDNRWDPRGKSTIDYGFMSEALLSLVRNFHVECPTPDPKDDWADHTRICVTLDAAAISRTPVAASVPQSVPEFTGSEEVDRLYQATMDAKALLPNLYEPSLPAPEYALASVQH